jgi:hypothetical protein
MVDHAGSLAGVACPSASLCVAVDSAGNVLSSVHPSKTGAWGVARVSQRPLTGVSCGSRSLCVAIVKGGGVHSLGEVNNAGSVIVSTSPAEGASAWKLSHIDGFLGTYCGKDGPWSECGNSLTGVSCPSAALCVAVDQLGYVFHSRTPAGSPDSWNPGANGGPRSSRYDAVACASGRLCVAICSVNVGLGAAVCPGSQGGAGDVVAWNPSTWNSPPFHYSSLFSTISPTPLRRIWCIAASVCFASSRTRLYASADPAHGRRSWRLSYRDHSGIVALACPTKRECLTIDGAGRLLKGTPPAEK